MSSPANGTSVAAPTPPSSAQGAAQSAPWARRGRLSAIQLRVDSSVQQPTRMIKTITLKSMRQRYDAAMGMPIFSTQIVPKTASSTLPKPCNEGNSHD